MSILHLDIRSVPLHFSEFLCYLDTLDLEFKIIALSETGINNHHAVYNIPHYNLEMDHRHKCEPLYPQYSSIQNPKRSG